MSVPLVVRAGWGLFCFRLGSLYRVVWLVGVHYCRLCSRIGRTLVPRTVFLLDDLCRFVAVEGAGPFWLGTLNRLLFPF